MGNNLECGGGRSWKASATYALTPAFLNENRRYNFSEEVAITQPEITPIRPDIEQPEAIPAPATTTREEYAAWTLVGAALCFVLFDKLVSGVVAGFTLYILLKYFARRIEGKRTPGRLARVLSLLIVTMIAGGFMTAAFAFLIAFLRGRAGNLPALMTAMADVLSSTKIWLAKLGGLGDLIPAEVVGDAEDAKGFIIDWLKENAQVVKSAGGFFGRAVIHVIMGSLLALLVFFRRRIPAEQAEPRGALANELIIKVGRFADSFRQIVSAQLKISAVNTTLTALYVLVALPLAGRPLPFALTIVVVTFICGLIPILGNLISNTVIVIISMGVSMPTAVASLTFLVVIHKLEYLINSKIVGGKTDSQAWEILLAIIIGESAFGVAGVIMAPIIYSFVKRELRIKGLV